MKRLHTLLSIFLACACAAFALPAGHYAQHSRLAEGRWVKIAVPSSGLYRITAAQLRSWGFSSPDAVRVYGYGGRRIPDLLSAGNYIDDLPLVQSISSARGIIFYAAGPDELTMAKDGEHYTVLSSTYTTAGYYFLSESGEPARSIPAAGVPEAADPATSFAEVLHHETESTSPGNVGPMLLGEDFRLTPKRTFAFNAPGRVPDTDLWLQCGFVAETPSAPSYVEFSVNGTDLDRVPSDAIPTMSAASYQHAMMTVAAHTFRIPAADRLNIEVRHSSPSSPVYKAWLDHITVNYERSLAMPSDGSALEFRTTSSRLRLTGAGADVTVWDITDPLAITRMNTGSAGEWTNDYTGLRRYVAFSDASRLPEPEFAGSVANTDLHAHSGIDMVIFTPAELKAASERIAAIHRAEPDTMRVAVVALDDVYNEFGSGAPDVSALRKYLKMLYDRGADPAGHSLRYALLMGRATFDHRRLTAEMQRATWPIVPGWTNRDKESSLNDSYSFVTDDFIAMLDDNSGTSMALDNLCIAVGRIPAASAAEASAYVDKLEQYMGKANRTPWKNSVLVLADDGDAEIHVKQAEEFVSNIMADPGQQHIVTKVYTDAYPLVSGVYQQARDYMMRRLEEGSVWWTYVGHGSDHSLTGEGLITYSDLNSLFLRNVPFLYAATCDFMRWDDTNASGAEQFLNERNGGCIGVICATRPVYIPNNGYLTAAMGRALARRGPDGQYMRTGDIYRTAKNNILNDAGNRDTNTNRLRYAFAGDPAMRLTIPSCIVRVDSIDGVPFDPAAQPTLAALQQAVVSGHVEGPDGSLLSDFDGTATIELYDAEYTVLTNGNNEGEQIPFESMGAKLLTVSAPVAAGRFSATVAMPSDISDNFRPATLNMYAFETSGARDAVGVNRDLYVYGTDIEAPADTEAPSIDSFLINHSGFRSGDAVSTVSPMVMCSVSDNVGINISSAGVGHQIVLTLDSLTTYSDVALYYRPHSDGTPGGTFNYPLPDVAPGLHSLRLRVWDTSGNPAESTVEFFAEEGLAPQIFDLYTDANPARTAANFYITHDAPDAMATVTVTVYNMLGNPVWTRTERGRSDMFTTTPVSWDLRDSSGRRVERGIYIYRATITVDGETHSTAARKLAVTAY